MTHVLIICCMFTDGVVIAEPQLKSEASAAASADELVAQCRRLLGVEE